MDRLITIQYLRGLAAVLVVLFHATGALLDRGVSSTWRFEAGAYGVDIFFVISGFVIWRSTATHSPSPARFMLRRAVRIIPLYWMFTALTAALAVGGTGITTTEVDPRRLLLSALFIPHWDPGGGTVAPLLIPGWTLNLEMAFYLVFAGALVLPRRWRAFPVLGILLTVSASRLLLGTPEQAALNLYTDSVVLEFALGVALGWAFTGDRVGRGLPWVGTALVIVGLLPLLLDAELPPARGLRWGVPAAAMVAGALLLEPLAARRPRRRLKRLGDSSYSLYLGHLGVVTAGAGALPAPLAAMPLLALALLVIIAVVFGLLVHRVIERPVHQRLRQRLVPAREPGSPGPAGGG